MTSSLRSDSALTLIEVLMTLVLLSILSFASIELVGNALEESRYEQTLQKMERIKIALIGDPSIRENGTRTSFGYVGDVGQLPDFTQGLEALVTRPSAAPTAEVPPYEMDNDARFGAGWNGPYLFSALGSVDTLLDAWGNEIFYDPTETPPVIRSYGADGLDDSVGDLTGYNKDIVIELPEELWLGTVYGYVNNRGAPFLGEAYATLFLPNLDWPTPTPVVTSEEVILTDYTLSPPSPGDPVGQFSFTGVPFGKRSVMVVVPTPAMTLGPVIFTMDRKNVELNENAFDISNP